MHLLSTEKGERHGVQPAGVAERQFDREKQHLHSARCRHCGWVWPAPLPPVGQPTVALCGARMVGSAEIYDLGDPRVCERCAAIVARLPFHACFATSGGSSACH